MRAAPGKPGRRNSVRAISRGPLITVLLVLAALLAAGGGRGSEDGGSAGGGEPAGHDATGSAIVTRVVDGDSAILAGLGRSRLIGVDTPELHPRMQCFGAEAAAFARRTLERRRLRFELGAEPRDRYGRALVYVWLADGRLFNELLVVRGYARTLAIAPNVRYAERFGARAREARRARRGLWSASACAADRGRASATGAAQWSRLP